MQRVNESQFTSFVITCYFTVTELEKLVLVSTCIPVYIRSSYVP